MKITKRQLRRIIREEKARLLNEAMAGPELQEEERQYILAIEQFINKYAELEGMEPQNLPQRDKDGIRSILERIFSKQMSEFGQDKWAGFDLGPEV